MNISDQMLLDTVLRTDFDSFLRRCLLTLNPNAPFQPNWHIGAIAHQLHRVRRGEVTRLIINMPPRHLKSLIVSVVFPAFLLGLEPWHRIFAISYGGDLSDKHANDFRSIVGSAWYRRAFPKMRIKRSHDDEVITTARGFRKSTSVMGALTGLGGDLFIIDDPQKPIDAQSESRRESLNQWFANTLLSRLDNKETGAIIVVMQRVHMDDLTGFLLGTTNHWEHLSLPAIAESDERVQIGEDTYHFRRTGQVLHPERESLTTLDALRNTLGSDVFTAQYQQSPVPAGGAMIKRAWLRFYDKVPQRTAATKVIQSWDTAAKGGAHNDWSVCTTWLYAEKNFYLLDLTRGRYDYPRLREIALAAANHHRPNVLLIEDASTGSALAQELRQSHNFAVKLVPVERDKEARLYVHQAKFEAGLVHFPKNAPFLKDLLAELLAFPLGRTDDQVDSISQALSHPTSGYGWTKESLDGLADLYHRLMFC